MENPLKIRMNVCKSWPCPNLGIADAADYSFPVYRLGYRAMECMKCGGLPPLFDEKECNDWFAQLMKRKQGDTGIGCPHCYSLSLICYGRTQSGSTRFQCRDCKHVFTPKHLTQQHMAKIEQILFLLSLGHNTSDTEKYRSLAQAVNWYERNMYDPAEVIKNMATQIYSLSFQGKTAKQYLYIIVSTDVKSGRVLQITSNYCPWEAGDSLHYQSSRYPVAEICDAEPVEQVQRREAEFMTRSQFDEIHYGSAEMKRNEQGSIVRPVIAMHGHFQRLKRRYPCVSHHYLAHECVLRGAAITAWSSEVRSGKTHLWYVVEQASKAIPPGTVFCHTGTWRIGWWDNIWQQWSTNENSKVIGLLTGQKQIEDPSHISLASADLFINWVKAHPWWANSGMLSAKVMSFQLICLAHLYNQHLFPLPEPAR